MKTFRLSVVFIGICVPLLALAEDINWSFLGKTDPQMAQKIYKTSINVPEDLYAPDDENNSIHKWVNLRVNEAKDGYASLVRIPIETNFGWGCTPPSLYCLYFSGGGCVYVSLVGDTKLPTEYNVEKCAGSGENARAYCATSWKAEGYFTGQSKKICGEPDQKESEGCCTSFDAEYEFHVTKIMPSQNAGSSFNFDIILAGRSPLPSGNVIKNGPVWGVYISNIRMSDPNGIKKADKLVAKLNGLGYKKTSVIDSRLIPTLWCCFHTVLIDRFDTESEAKKLKAELAKKKIDNIIVGKLY